MPYKKTRKDRTIVVNDEICKEVEKLGLEEACKQPLYFLSSFGQLNYKQCMFLVDNLPGPNYSCYKTVDSTDTDQIVMLYALTDAVVLNYAMPKEENPGFSCSNISFWNLSSKIDGSWQRVLRAIAHKSKFVGRAIGEDMINHIETLLKDCSQRLAGTDSPSALNQALSVVKEARALLPSESTQEKAAVKLQAVSEPAIAIRDLDGKSNRNKYDSLYATCSSSSSESVSSPEPSSPLLSSPLTSPSTSSPPNYHTNFVPSPSTSNSFSSPISSPLTSPVSSSPPRQTLWSSSPPCSPVSSSPLHAPWNSSPLSESSSPLSKPLSSSPLGSPISSSPLHAAWSSPPLCSSESSSPLCKPLSSSPLNSTPVQSPVCSQPYFPWIAQSSANTSTSASSTSDEVNCEMTKYHGNCSCGMCTPSLRKSADFAYLIEQEKQNKLTSVAENCENIKHGNCSCVMCTPPFTKQTYPGSPKKADVLRPIEQEKQNNPLPSLRVKSPSKLLSPSKYCGTNSVLSNSPHWSVSSSPQHSGKLEKGSLLSPINIGDSPIKHGFWCECEMCLTPPQEKNDNLKKTSPSTSNKKAANNENSSLKSNTSNKAMPHYLKPGAKRPLMEPMLTKPEIQNKKPNLTEKPMLSNGKIDAFSFMMKKAKTNKKH